ncbi:mitochondrial genome maintenance protein mgm101 [Xylaria bambusicola]|uniref:mitochondrial genome maintenance protein mgm101 n=1 Tax=Xylaria bambusicola TaxID=326684 RepID=UPI002007E547|nr:mitochondrial genome maintenance protein mgm101 [Xylaria bambusicola]KAI0518022.1 mitochondrial genome maintenance protein mgm101 [Xylaria bambusicola]
MSKKEDIAQKTASVPLDDDEPDEWDKRIFSTGCADENANLTECYWVKKDWRACKREVSCNGGPIDWTNSYHGLGTIAFSAETSAILQARLDPDDIEVKPDGIIYLPEIKYRRILNTAFGPGGWGLAPRGELIVQDRLVTREYALVANGRFVGQARGEQQYFSEDGVSTAAEGCKSNALMRCCKDLGIASELWDPRFIRKFMKEHAVQQWVEHVTTKKKKQIWLRKDDEVRYPFKKS